MRRDGNDEGDVRVTKVEAMNEEVGQREVGRKSWPWLAVNLS